MLLNITTPTNASFNPGRKFKTQANTPKRTEMPIATIALGNPSGKVDFTIWVKREAAAPTMASDNKSVIFF